MTNSSFALPLSVFQIGIALIGLTSVFGLAFGDESSYSPLDIPAAWKASTIDITVRAASPDRDIPLRVYLPASSNAAPVILFSHGLGGSRTANPYLGHHWAGRGYPLLKTVLSLLFAFISIFALAVESSNQAPLPKSSKPKPSIVDFPPLQESVPLDFRKFQGPNWSERDGAMFGKADSKGSPLSR